MKLIWEFFLALVMLAWGILLMAEVVVILGGGLLLFAYGVTQFIWMIKALR